ncbi:MAG: shikimate kinase [Lentisphaeria bacterium]|mgnify:CR=1 FL=1|jgi:shikimate kinase|nr:shikimate kinase [Lentisphaeria bacterium]MDP7740920.1 shikimate kinase [Lentisphaeria bacterium]
MKIVLIGYRASGKSTLGPALSEQLGWPLYDVDGDIQERYGCSLTEAFSSDKEAYRDVETDVVETLCRHDRCVIAFGAGSILRPQNQVAAGRDSLVVYLKLDAAELWRRAEADPISADTRPNFRGGGLQEVEEMLQERGPVYQACANLTLDATAPPEALARQVVEALEERMMDQT